MKRIRHMEAAARAVPDAKVIGVFRKCERCGRWRPLGRFSHWLSKGRTHTGHVCHDCFLRGQPRLRTSRFWWPVKQTDG